MKNKFYEIKNFINNKADLYIYGEIVIDDSNWWTGEKDENLVGLQAFKKELDDLGDLSDLNIYINSPGGEVFVASTMCSMIQRLKDKGTKIHTYVDGLCASAATFLLMTGDDINIYQNSVVMIHKPSVMCWGNANDMQKCIDMLDIIENSTMIPLYMKKSLKTEDEIKEKINAESWMGADEVVEYFDVNLLEDENKAVACVNSNIFKNYKHVPENLIKLLNKEEVKDEIKEHEIIKIDYSDFENRLQKLN